MEWSTQTGLLTQLTDDHILDTHSSSRQYVGSPENSGTVALSSVEAEYMALSEATKEAIYLQDVLRDITGSYDYTVLFNDSSRSSAFNMWQQHTTFKNQTY